VPAAVVVVVAVCYPCEVHSHGMQRLLVASMAIVVVAGLAACRGKSRTRDASPAETTSAAQDTSDPSERIRRSEEAAAQRDSERRCERPTTIYEGSIAVDSNEYVQSVERGDDFVDEPIDGLDRVVTKASQVRFTLDYPFERPFEGVVSGEITLRRTIDAIRAGFRQMYVGTTEREVPGMYNKDVTGPYGQAFHVIGDLVIEGIELCGDDRFVIVVGS
jgi:hypothetical protein